MGTVIAFPAERSSRPPLEYRGEDARIVILPVIRIERYDDEPSGIEPKATTRRKRRKR